MEKAIFSVSIKRAQSPELTVEATSENFVIFFTELCGISLLNI